MKVLCLTKKKKYLNEKNTLREVELKQLCIFLEFQIVKKTFLFQLIKNRIDFLFLHYISRTIIAAAEREK